MGKMSRDKGKRGELEVAKVFTAAGLIADRTAALQAGSVPGTGDVTLRAWRGLHIECKRTETYSLPEWMRQVDAARGDDDYAVCFRKSCEPWRAVVDLEWLVALLADNIRGALA